MKKKSNEETRKLAGLEPTKEVSWQLSEEDKKFLRSLNVSPE